MSRSPSQGTLGFLSFTVGLEMFESDKTHLNTDMRPPTHTPQIKLYSTNQIVFNIMWTMAQSKSIAGCVCRKYGTCFNALGKWPLSGEWKGLFTQHVVSFAVFAVLPLPLGCITGPEFSPEFTGPEEKLSYPTCPNAVMFWSFLSLCPDTYGPELASRETISPRRVYVKCIQELVLISDSNLERTKVFLFPCSWALYQSLLINGIKITICGMLFGNGQESS